ncbi:hypothetical protein [Umezawaea sp. NPDC059074]|uniref:hypothetical protein n=1 Tax=Umezawaea sp. NPDC059074 TaxID=3346716 RepID=UPI003686614B
MAEVIRSSAHGRLRKIEEQMAALSTEASTPETRQAFGGLWFQREAVLQELRGTWPIGGRQASTPVMTATAGK